MSRDVEIRIIRSDEWREFKRVRLDGLQHDPRAFGRSYDEAAALSDDAWIVQFSDPRKRIYYGAYCNDVLVGITGVRFEDAQNVAHIATLTAVYVMPAFRKQGIATKLLERVLHDLRSNQRTEKVHLDANTSQLAAVALYTKLGFQAIGVARKELKVNGVYYDEYKMELLFENLTSERLILVPTSETYREDIFREFDADIVRFMNPVPPKDISETDAFIAKSQNEMSEGKELQFVILEKTTKEFLGCCGLHYIDTKTPELGIWIKKSAHGHAYGREAMAILKQWADENLNYDHIQYPVAKENIPSRKIAESLGGVLTKEFRKKNGMGIEMDWMEYQISSTKQ